MGFGLGLAVVDGRREGGIGDAVNVLKVLFVVNAGQVSTLVDPESKLLTVPRFRGILSCDRQHPEPHDG